MSLPRLGITAVVVEGRSKSEMARDYDITRFWVQALVNASKPRETRRLTSRARDDGVVLQ
jgi:hypothetical protein